MAGTTVGKLSALLTADTSQFIQNLTKAEAGVGSFASSLTGIAGTLGIGFGLQSFLTGAIEEANEAAKSQGKLEAAIFATGNAAGVTSESIDALSNAMQKQLAIDNDVIKSAAATLISFKDINAEIINRALPAMADFSRFTGKDMSEAALIFGKALADPIGGTKALEKAGARLTAEQKKQILAFMEAGDIASAQAIILDRVASSFEGSAEKMKTSTDEITVAWKDLQEEAGKELVIPVVVDVAGGGAAGDIARALPQFEGLGPMAIRLWGEWTSGAEEAADATEDVSEAVQELQDESAFFTHLSEIQQENLDKVTDALKEQIDTFGMSADEITVWKLKQKGMPADAIEFVQALQQEKQALVENKDALDRDNKALDEQKRAADAAQKSIDDTIKSMQEYTATLGMSSDQIKVWKLQQEGASELEVSIAQGLDETNKYMTDFLTNATTITSIGAHDQLQEWRDDMVALTDAFEAGTLSLDAYNNAVEKITDAINKNLKADMQKVFEETRTPAEKIKKEIEDLNNLRIEGLDDDTYFRRLQQLEDQLAGVNDQKDELMKLPAAMEFGTAAAFSATRPGPAPEIGDPKTHEKLEEMKKILDAIRDAIRDQVPIEVGKI